MAWTWLAFVTVLGMYVGMRAWGRYDDEPVLRRVGLALMVIVTLQIVLGVVALVAVFMEGETPGAFDVIATTVHQTNGALLFGSTAVVAFSFLRLTEEAPAEAAAVAT